MSSLQQLSIASQQLLDWLETPACIVRLPDTLIQTNAAFATLCSTSSRTLTGTSLRGLLPERSEQLAGPLDGRKLTATN